MVSVGLRAKAGRLSLALVVALGCVTLTALPAWAGKEGGKPRNGLEVESLQVGTKAGPLAVRVKAEPSARVQVWVNGKRVRHDFEFAGERSKEIELRRGDGLRAGANALLIRSADASGTLSARRTVELPRLVLLADAGEDASATPRTRAGVGAAALAGARGAGSRYRWSVVGRPRGAKASVRGTNDPRSVLHARKPGTYRLQLAVDPAGPGPVAFDQVTVTVAPNDRPIGVPINTIDPQHAIAIAGKAYGANAGGGRTAYVVLERATRQPATDATGNEVAGSVINDAPGLKKLTTLAETYGKAPNVMKYLMIISGEKMPSAQLADFGRLAKKLGAAILSEEDFAALAAGRQYSIVGLPGAAEEAATVRIPDLMYRGSTSGAISGYLQKLTSVNLYGAPVYSYVSPEYPSFDTRSASSATSDTMTIGSKVVEDSLRNGATAGFLVVSVDPFTGNPYAVNPIATNAPTGSDRALQREAASSLYSMINGSTVNPSQEPNKPLILVQTIGKPKAAGPEWGGVVSQLARIGANPVLVNALDGTTEYALVGHLDSKQPAAESSTAYDHGPYGDPGYPAARLVGSLARARNYRFEVTVSSTPNQLNPAGAVNLGLIALAYQKPEGFPALGADLKPAPADGEAAAAESYICKTLELCGSANGCPDMRTCYWQKYGETWSLKRSELGELGFPEGSKDFEKRVFIAVKAQLLIEIGALIQDKTFFEKLLRPLEQTEAKSFLDIKEISKKVLDSLKRQPASNTTSWVLGLIGKIVALGGFAGPPVSAGAAGLSAAFALASYLSNETGQPILGAEVEAAAESLGTEVDRRISLARQSAYGLGKLAASDYGKLMDLSRHARGDWEPPDNPEAVATPLRTASRQWFFEALVPTAYPYLVRANNNARNIDCTSSEGSAYKAWPSQPDSAQMWVTIGYDGNGNPIKNMFFFTRGLGSLTSPPDSLAQEMFKPLTAGGLGIEKLSFFTPRVFGGKVAHAVNTGRHCELGRIPIEN